MLDLTPETRKLIDKIERESPLNAFKLYFAQGCKESRQIDHDHVGVTQETLEATQETFHGTINYVNNLLYHSDIRDEQQQELGQWLHAEFIGFSLLGTWPSRSLRKPQKIAGDHHTIKQIYADADQERRDVGKIVNHCFLSDPACQAVVNRKEHVRQKIHDLRCSTKDDIHVLSIASGPAEELFDVLQDVSEKDRSQLHFHGVDLDLRACSFVADEIKSKKLARHFSVHHGDILKKRTVEDFANSQDLVYSMGLIDYFSDRVVIKVINHMYETLKVGGEIIIGNFHERCPSRCWLDYILDWKLIYRTEEDMTRLFKQSHFACEPIIEYEPLKVNMLVRCQKR